MCDQDHFEEDRRQYEALGLVTRKQFGVMLGAGMAMMLPRVANAVAVAESEVAIFERDRWSSGGPAEETVLPNAHPVVPKTYVFGTVWQVSDPISHDRDFSWIGGFPPLVLRCSSGRARDPMAQNSLCSHRISKQITKEDEVPPL